MFGRSCCPSCRQSIKWYDLVPLLSFLILGGRCRFCKNPISLRYPVVEVITALLFLIMYVRFGTGFTFLKYLILCSLLIAAAFIDLELYLIPNTLVIAGLLLGIPLTIMGHDVTLLSALLGSIASGGFLLLAAVLSKGGMGGGDIKLAAVVGFYLGWPLGLLGIFLGACMGGLIGLFLLLFRIKKRKDPIPFGPFIALGALAALLWGRTILNFYFYGVL